MDPARLAAVPRGEAAVSVSVGKYRWGTGSSCSSSDVGRGDKPRGDEARESPPGDVTEGSAAVEGEKYRCGVTSCSSSRATGRGDKTKVGEGGESGESTSALETAAAPPDGRAV